MLLGLLTVVAGYVANDVLTSSCEETPGLHNEACVTSAAMIIGGLGFFLFVVVGISLYALCLGGFLGATWFACVPCALLSWRSS